MLSEIDTLRSNKPVAIIVYSILSSFLTAHPQGHRVAHRVVPMPPTLSLQQIFLQRGKSVSLKQIYPSVPLSHCHPDIPAFLSPLIFFFWIFLKRGGLNFHSSPFFLESDQNSVVSGVLDPGRRCPSTLARSVNFCCLHFPRRLTHPLDFCLHSPLPLTHPPPPRPDFYYFQTKPSPIVLSMLEKASDDLTHSTVASVHCFLFPDHGAPCVHATILHLPLPPHPLSKGCSPCSIRQVLSVTAPSPLLSRLLRRRSRTHATFRKKMRDAVGVSSIASDNNVIGPCSD